MGAPDPDADVDAKPKSRPHTEREVRLAKALRDNLRRRKAGARAGTPAREGDTGPR
jgi:hypothetical protein